ncbi:YSIRK-type signal peptide-containing protein [Lactobacillus crispatus]|uniref:YSIRK-type signal peptide-containing protein n=1 Tax=Lactobacillus crispatus TaxID=47770 RepID=A0A7H9EBE7_9LACO|nr:YSIRK-type signal peptide-containing protein [Lactobacillus crispatus]
MSQHFSIRKYHFGAASVLLGVAIVLGTSSPVNADQLESGTSYLRAQLVSDFPPEAVEETASTTSEIFPTIERDRSVSDADVKETTDSLVAKVENVKQEEPIGEQSVSLSSNVKTGQQVGDITSSSEQENVTSVQMQEEPLPANALTTSLALDSGLNLQPNVRISPLATKLTI